MPVTRGAEGLDRLAFSVDDIARMVEHGVLEPGERLELLGGDLVPMADRGERECRLEASISRAWNTIFSPPCTFAHASGLRLAPRYSVVPDFIVFDRARNLADLCGPDVLLVVEVSEAALDYDLRFKPPIYASFGVRELWVVDAVHRVTHRHLHPDPGKYRDISVVTADERLQPAYTAIAFGFSLDDLDELDAGNARLQDAP